MCGEKDMWKFVVEMMLFDATNENGFKDFMYILLYLSIHILSFLSNHLFSFLLFFGILSF